MSLCIICRLSCFYISARKYIGEWRRTTWTTEVGWLWVQSKNSAWPTERTCPNRYVESVVLTILFVCNLIQYSSILYLTNSSSWIQSLKMYLEKLMSKSTLHHSLNIHYNYIIKRYISVIVLYFESSTDSYHDWYQQYSDHWLGWMKWKKITPQCW